VNARDAARAAADLDAALAAADDLCVAEAGAKSAGDAYVAAAKAKDAHDAAGLVAVDAALPPRTRAVRKQVDPRYLAKLDAFRPTAADFTLPEDDLRDLLAAPAPPCPEPAAYDEGLPGLAYAFPQRPPAW
jgi:hypothetical protein